jgi:outer membrane protein assembly factor BamA
MQITPRAACPRLLLFLVLLASSVVGQQQKAPNPFEEVQEAQGLRSDQGPSGTIVAAIEFRGLRRIPKENIQARLYMRPGDTFDAGALCRDFRVLWNTGYFDDLRIEIEGIRLSNATLDRASGVLTGCGQPRPRG